MYIKGTDAHQSEKCDKYQPDYKAHTATFMSISYSIISLEEVLLYEVYDQNYQQQQYGNGTGIADAEILECVGVYNIGYTSLCRCAAHRL